MQTAFTIGILGGCGNSSRTTQYFEQVVTYYRKIFPRIRILLPLASKGERLVASSLLEQKRNNPGLDVGVVVSARQWKSRLNGRVGCSCIITAADRCEVLDSAAHQGWSGLYRFFIEQCDYIIFNEHHAGWRAAGEFSAQVVKMAVPIPVQYGLKPLQYPDISHPIDRREYLDPESKFHAPTAEIEQSVVYLQRNDFNIRADHVPLIFIRKWLAAPPPEASRYLIPPEDTSGILRLQDTLQHDYLSLKVFVHAYTMYRIQREMLPGADALMCFRQFRALLELIAAKRDAGDPIEPFDLLDFDGYRKVLKSLVREVDAEATNPIEMMEAR